MELWKVKGNTFCIDTGISYIPFYRINETELILLDTGWAQADRVGVEEIFEEKGYRVAGIICSHAHVDHIGNCQYFKEKYHCVVAMSELEALLCSSPVNLKVYYSSQTLAQVKKNLGQMICKVDIPIPKDQEKIQIAGAEFRILHTPGHSPAHICVITPDDVAYLGDTLVSRDVMEPAKLPYEYILKEALKSNDKLLELSCSKYIVAHKGEYDEIKGLVSENRKLHERKAERVLALIDHSMTREEIMKTAMEKLKIPTRSDSRYLTLERMLNTYVEYLHDTGRLDLVMEDGFLKYSVKKVSVG
ncbi:MAG: hydrolase [Bacillota bacterium]|nr:hydrolase [Bacillota bacterium]